MDNYVHPGMRALLGNKDEDCVRSAVDQFPSGLFSKELRQDGVIGLHFLISFYMFAALSVICHDYYVPAIEHVVKACNLANNVVGASIMPVVASTPQLAITVIGVFLVHDDIGLGSVVGSTFFNILFVPGIFSFLVTSTIVLPWWPVARDSFVYCGATIILLYVICDSVISWIDTAIMATFYFLYLIALSFNTRLEAVAHRMVAKIRCCRNPEGEKHALVNTAESTTDTKLTYSALQSQEPPSVVSEEKDTAKVTASKPTCVNKCSDEVDDYRSVLSVPDGCGRRVAWVLLLPVLIPIYVCIPDCKRPGCWSQLYLLTIVVCVFFIGVSSYVLVWMMAIIGDTFDLNDVVVGMTILAIGGSIPDMLNSIFVARDGHGDMAFANSMGSNIFEILFCLALPWLLEYFKTQDNIRLKDNMMFVIVCLVSTSLLPLAFIAINGWQINRRLGAIFIGVYFLFIGVDTYYELRTAQPTCDST